jgi:hypothetical protein
MQHDHARVEASPPTWETDALSAFYCPECGMPAWVEWRDVAGSTAGAVAHVKVRCFARHWFLMLEDGLTAA